MTNSADKPKPCAAIDSYLGACWVCTTMFVALLIAYKNHYFTTTIAQLNVGAWPNVIPSPFPWWLIVPLAIVPLVLIPASRILGIVPIASAMALVATIAELGIAKSEVAMQAFFLSVALTIDATAKYKLTLLSRLRTNPAWRVRPPRIDWVIATVYLSIFLSFIAVYITDRSIVFSLDYEPFVVGASLFFFLYSWIRLFRPFFEVCLEAVFWRNYRVTSTGPGATGLPLHGPLIVIANHACWWDPLFLAKVLPRPVTPMMTSIFYDRWFLKPLVKYVFGAIRVEDARVRREAPEIQEAIRALDEGKCLILFPESFLRRKEEVPLRRFGRGIWEILKARPDTPVVCCWIEGAWGSYSSFWNGPPTKNKVKERRRPITIGMSAPVTVPAEKLERHLAARIHLMNEVSAARTHLGLPPLPPFELPAKDDEAAPEQPA